MPNVTNNDNTEIYNLVWYEQNCLWKNPSVNLINTDCFTTTECSAFDPYGINQPQPGGPSKTEGI